MYPSLKIEEKLSAAALRPTLDVVRPLTRRVLPATKLEKSKSQRNKVYFER